MAYMKKAGATLETSAAYSLERAAKAARVAKPVITSSLRSSAEGAGLFHDRYVPSSGVFDRGPFGDRRGPYQGRYWKRMRGLPVSIPGTSKHERGLAIDLPPTSPLAKYLRNHAEFGWWQPLPKSDPVHWEYRIDRDRVRAAKVARMKAVAKARVKSIRGTLGLRGWKAPFAKRRTAQRHLKGWGYYKGTIDGVYGPLNKAAWRALKAAAK